MNLFAPEIREALLEGKRVRKGSFAPGVYLQLDYGELRVFNPNRNPTRFIIWLSDLEDNDWEIIEENPHKEGTWGWARWHMERGRACICHTSDAEIQYRMIKQLYGYDLIHGANSGERHYAYLSTDKLDATDWRLVD